METCWSKTKRMTHGQILLKEIPTVSVFLFFNQIKQNVDIQTSQPLVFGSVLEPYNNWVCCPVVNLIPLTNFAELKCITNSGFSCELLIAEVDKLLSIALINYLNTQCWI